MLIEVANAVLTMLGEGRLTVLPVASRPSASTLSTAIVLRLNLATTSLKVAPPASASSTELASFTDWSMALSCASLLASLALTLSNGAVFSGVTDTSFRICQPNESLIGWLTPPGLRSNAALPRSPVRSSRDRAPRSTASALSPATFLATAAKSLPCASAACTAFTLASSGTSICCSTRFSGSTNSSWRLVVRGFQFGVRELDPRGVLRRVDQRHGEAATLRQHEIVFVLVVILLQRCGIGRRQRADCARRHQDRGGHAALAAALP